MNENNSSISQAANYEEMGEFWDTRDFTEFDDPKRPDVVFEIRDTVRIEAKLLAKIEKVAASRGIGSETLINLWLQEKVLANQ
ncbi:MAG: CopG family antitoxin [Chloroflexota bacterium]